MQLFERWQAVVAECSDTWALRDRTLGKTWTFAELASEVESLPRREPLSITRESGAGLIVETLAAWRDNRVFCPLEPQSPVPPIADVARLPEGIAHVKLTSGSSGEPRAVLFRGRQLAADAANIVATMGLRRQWPNLGVISLTHSYGFSNLVLPLLLHGIPLDWLGDPLPGAVAALLRERPGEPLTLAAVPAMWRAWHAAGALDVGPDRVALAISAGASLPANLERCIYEDCGIKVHNFYGSSECGGIAYDRTLIPRSSGEVIGEAMVNVNLSVDADGCMVVAGEAVGEGYWPAEEGGGKCRLGSGRFLTNDLAELSEMDLLENERTGRPVVTLKGRRDDMINVAGRKVSPARVEAAILRDPAVRHCVVFGVTSDEPSRMQETVAVVSPGGQGEFDLESLKSALAARLQRHELPRRWWLCRQLQPDGRGKISRAGWRERYLSEQSEYRSGT